VAQGLLVFYDLQAAQKREQIANEKVAMASRLLALAKKAKQAERVSDAEVWDVESSLNRFKVAALEASQSRVEQSGKLQTLLMQDASEVHPMWPDALPEKALDAADSKELLDKALTHRGDYRRLQLMLQRAESQLRYMDNQRKPRVDLNLSYGRNGLAFESQKAFALDATKDTPSWSVVLNIQMPLGTNVQGQAGYAQARARVEEARLTLQALEVSIRNDIASSVRLVESVKQRWGHWSAVADRETNQLVLERKRLENGRSDMRELLFKEERSMNARMSVVEQQASYAKALVLQKAAAGSVISDYLVE
jgi:outer membrane protein TolC